MQYQITSQNNPLVKQVVKLQTKPAERKRSGLFVVEGRRETSMALTAGIRAEYVFVCSEVFQEDPAYPVLERIPKETSLIYVGSGVYNKMAYRKDMEGVIMLGTQQSLNIRDLNPGRNALIIILESLEKPGNLGAILRTADAAGADAIILSDAKTDVYNPNAIRASLGCIFTIPLAVCTGEEARVWLKDTTCWPEKQRPKLYAAALQTKTNYESADFTGPIALVFGAEDTGLSEPWRQAADQIIRIPMEGTIDSLNVGVSVAVMAFEAKRQRRKH